MDYLIDEKLAKEILNYLAGRPYIEVSGLIQKLQGIKRVDKPEIVKVEPKNEVVA